MAMPIEKIPNVLACDVGNSTVHFAHVQGEVVGHAGSVRVNELAALREALTALWGSIPPPRKIVVASVSPPGLNALESAVQEALGEPVLVIGRDLSLPAETDLPEPEKIGVDRLCSAAAAFDRAGTACVVADFGTSVTIDCINDEGVFVGGAILPGLRMAAESLAGGTTQLPNVKPVEPDWVFGKDTRQAIVGGLVFGARGALRALVESYATELGHWPVVFLTGGDAELIAGDLCASDLVQAVVPELVLRGVAIAYYKTLLG